jgi:hypothetical protein
MKTVGIPRVMICGEITSPARCLFAGGPSHSWSFFGEWPEDYRRNKGITGCAFIPAALSA